MHFLDIPLSEVTLASPPHDSGGRIQSLFLDHSSSEMIISFVDISNLLIASINTPFPTSTWVGGGNRTNTPGDGPVWSAPPEYAMHFANTIRVCGGQVSLRYIMSPAARAVESISALSVVLNIGANITASTSMQCLALNSKSVNNKGVF